MAKHKFSFSRRISTWTAYHYRCAYCFKELKLEEMEMDHIVNEAVCLVVGVPWIHDDRNIAASCYDCNHLKDEQLCLSVIDARTLLAALRGVETPVEPEPDCLLKF